MAEVGQAQKSRPSAAGKTGARRWIIATVVAAGAVGLAAAPGMAQQVTSPRPTVQPQPQSPLAGARKAVSDAQTALLQSKAAEDKVVQAVQAWFASKPDFAAATDAVNKAKADYEAAVKPVKEAVESTQAYQDLVSQKVDAQKTLDSANDANSGVSDEDVSKAADVVVKARLGMLNMESDALANDAKVAAAKEELKEANEEMASLQQQVTDALATNPDYIAAQKDVQQKTDALQQAQNSLSQQEKANRPQPRP